MESVLRYLTQGTEGTRTFATFGTEIETHLLNDDGSPISSATCRKLLALDTSSVPWRLTNDLGRQLIELAIEPTTSVVECLNKTHDALTWLYEEAKKRGAFPLHAPVLDWDGPLLLEPEGEDADVLRDQAFIALDGRPALEELCRIAAVQFTVSVNPRDAMALSNKVLAARLHERDYPNERNWQAYIATANIGYGALRYGGPQAFTSMADYAKYIESHPIFMRGGQLCEMPLHIRDLDDSHTDLAVALRNVWNYVRLKRFGNDLVMEVRPFSRRTDDKIDSDMAVLASILGF